MADSAVSDSSSEVISVDVPSVFVVVDSVVSVSVPSVSVAYAGNAAVKRSVAARIRLKILCLIKFSYFDNFCFCGKIKKVWECVLHTISLKVYQKTTKNKNKFFLKILPRGYVL